MKRTHFKERSKRGRIDLTMIGREEMVTEAIARMKEQDLAFYMEDERQANVPQSAPPKPFTPVKLTTAQALKLVKGIIIKELLALRP